MVHEVESFYGVYLLYCLNPKYKGRTYIGYTVDPNRRIKQHNTGTHAGGAYRTSGRGPWEMVLIIHGFPNDICGLRFEWAWQNPDKSRRLRSLSPKTRKESAFAYRWRVVCNMLRTAPWSGLCLTVRWLKQDFYQEFPQGLEPPLHMPIEFGPVVACKVKGQSSQKKMDEDLQVASCHAEGSTRCFICFQTILSVDAAMTCLVPSCSMKSHMTCLARHFLNDASKLLPVEGTCPLCETTLSWGNLVRQRKGCYRHLSHSGVQNHET